MIREEGAPSREAPFESADGADVEQGQCPVCGSASQLRLPRVVDTVTREPFGIRACSRCGLAWTWPRPEDLAPYYGPAYHGGRHGASARFCLWRRRRLFWRLASTPGRLLDVGCGDGSFLRDARTRGWEVSGVELRTVAERLQRERLDVRPTTEAFADEAPFQAITLWHSLEHMADPVAVLRTLNGLLAPDGRLLIAVPDAGGLQAGLFGPHWLHLDCPRHLWHFDRGSLEILLHRSGWDVAWMGHQELEFDTFGWIQSLLNTWTGEPNGLFHALTGKPHALSPAEVALQVSFAALATLPALAATALSTLARRGGTLVVVARKPSSGEARNP